MLWTFRYYAKHRVTRRLVSWLMLLIDVDAWISFPIPEASGFQAIMHLTKSLVWLLSIWPKCNWHPWDLRSCFLTQNLVGFPQLWLPRFQEVLPSRIRVDQSEPLPRMEFISLSSEGSFCKLQVKKSQLMALSCHLFWSTSFVSVIPAVLRVLVLDPIKHVYTQMCFGDAVPNPFFFHLLFLPALAAISLRFFDMGSTYAKASRAMKLLLESRP